MTAMRMFGIVAAIGFAALAPVANAAPTDRAVIIRSCETQMFLSNTACGCLADKALSTLDPLQQAWLGLGATDVAHSAPLSEKMTAAEAHQVDTFMRTVPDQCAAKQAAR